MVQSRKVRSRFTTARILGLGALALIGAGLTGWTALHRIPGLAPFAADAARSLVGDDAVARAEDFAYRIEDRVKRVAHQDDAPIAHWETPPEPTIEPVDATSHEDAPKFRPGDVGPMHATQVAPGDGVWVPAGALPDVAYKTLLHPDPDRSYAELFVAAIDLRRVDVSLSAGTVEPENVTEGSDDFERSGRVPDAALGSLLAAFNGGFKTRHGRFGMRSDGVTFVPPKNGTCTLARYEDGALRIGTWETLPAPESMTWFRQTPGCMVEGGIVNPKLRDSKSWGATIDGDTVIRRSAVGLSSDGQTLFVGISNATHAEALARGMQHAGAVVVAQLDVNHSYPRVLFYEDGAQGKQVTPLAEGFVVEKGHYVTSPSKRDFFYVTSKPAQSLATGDRLAPSRG